MKRLGRSLLPPSPPRAPELILAPELAAILLLEHALDIAAQALLAEHPTLADDFATAHDDAPVLALAGTICRRAAALERILHRYRRAVRDSAPSLQNQDPHDDLPF
jgi:hypothetical protein